MKEKRQGVYGEVEKDIPAPTSTARGPKPKFDWSKLEIGDSFTVNKVGRGGLFSAVRNFNRANKTSIKIRTAKEAKDRYRCWRVE